MNLQSRAGYPGPMKRAHPRPPPSRWTTRRTAPPSALPSPSNATPAAPPGGIRQVAGIAETRAHDIAPSGEKVVGHRQAMRSSERGWRMLALRRAISQSASPATMLRTMPAAQELLAASLRDIENGNGLTNRDRLPARGQAYAAVSISSCSRSHRDDRPACRSGERRRAVCRDGAGREIAPRSAVCLGRAPHLLYWGAHAGASFASLKRSAILSANVRCECPGVIFRVDCRDMTELPIVSVCSKILFHPCRQPERESSPRFTPGPPIRGKSCRFRRVCLCQLHDSPSII